MRSMKTGPQEEAEEAAEEAGRELDDVYDNVVMTRDQALAEDHLQKCKAASEKAKALADENRGDVPIDIVAAAAQAFYMSALTWYRVDYGTIEQARQSAAAARDFAHHASMTAATAADPGDCVNFGLSATRVAKDAMDEVKRKESGIAEKGAGDGSRAADGGGGGGDKEKKDEEDSESDSDDEVLKKTIDFVKTDKGKSADVVEAEKNADLAGDSLDEVHNRCRDENKDEAKISMDRALNAAKRATDIYNKNTGNKTLDALRCATYALYASSSAWYCLYFVSLDKARFSLNLAIENAQLAETSASQVPDSEDLQKYAAAALKSANEVKIEVEMDEKKHKSVDGRSSGKDKDATHPPPSDPADPPHVDEGEAEEAPAAIETTLNAKIDELQAIVGAIPPLDPGIHGFKALLQALNDANTLLKPDQETLADAIKAAHEFANAVQPQVDAFLEEGKRLEFGTIESIEAKIETFMRKTNTAADADLDVKLLTKAIEAAIAELGAVDKKSQNLNLAAKGAMETVLLQCKAAHPSFAEHTGALRALDVQRAINASALDVARKAVNEKDAERQAALKVMARAGIGRMEQIYRSVSELQEHAEAAAGYLEKSFSACFDSPPQVEHHDVIDRASIIGKAMYKNKKALAAWDETARKEKDRIGKLDKDQIKEENEIAQRRDQHLYEEMDKAVQAFAKYRIKMVENKQVATTESTEMYEDAVKLMETAYQQMEDSTYEMSSLIFGKPEEEAQFIQNRFDLMATFLRAFHRIEELNAREDDGLSFDVNERKALVSQMYHSTALLKNAEDTVLKVGLRVYDTGSECASEFKTVLAHFHELAQAGGGGEEDTAATLALIENAARCAAKHHSARREAALAGFFSDTTHEIDVSENIPAEARLRPFAFLYNMFVKFAFSRALFRARALDPARTEESRSKYEERAQLCMRWIRDNIAIVLKNDYASTEVMNALVSASKEQCELSGYSALEFRQDLHSEELSRLKTRIETEIDDMTENQEKWEALTDSSIARSITIHRLKTLSDQISEGLPQMIRVRKLNHALLENQKELSAFWTKKVEISLAYVPWVAEVKRLNLQEQLAKISAATTKARGREKADIVEAVYVTEEFTNSVHQIFQNLHESFSEPISTDIRAIEARFRADTGPESEGRKAVEQARADADAEDPPGAGGGRVDPAAEAAKRAAEVEAARELEAAKEKAREAEARAGKLQRDLEEARAAISRGATAARDGDGSRAALEKAQADLKKVQDSLADADKAKGEAVKRAEEKAEKDLEKLREDNKNALSAASDKIKKAGEERDKAKNDLAGVQNEKRTADEAVAGLKRDLEAAKKATTAAEEKLRKDTESARTSHAADLARVKAEGVAEGRAALREEEKDKIRADLTAAGTTVGVIPMVLVGDYADHTKVLSDLCAALGGVDFAMNPIDPKVMDDFEAGITLYLGEVNTDVDPLLTARMTALQDFVVALTKNTKAAYTQKADLEAKCKTVEAARDDFRKDLGVMTGLRDGLSADNRTLTRDLTDARRDLGTATADLTNERAETARLGGELTTVTRERDTGRALIGTLTRERDTAHGYIAKLQVWGRNMQDVAQRQYAVYQKVAEFYGGFYELRPPNQDQQLDGEPE